MFRSLRSRQYAPVARPPEGHREPVTISTDNRPMPLRNAPAELFADTGNQMSFGERAALEGILSQLAPQLAIEIGTYEGGSLRRVAAHSKHVDTFDLDDLVRDKHRLSNVSFHQGDSRATVPAVLDWYATREISVDFALIDGDHSYEGVRADVLNVVSSPACRRTVILMHDTMHPPVRAAIESTALGDQPSVVYVELDFVAGYQFATGDFAGERYGGLGLVITGDRATDGYGEQPLQTLYAPRG